MAWRWEAAVAKRYRVTLTAAEREALGGMISRGKADARKLAHRRDDPPGVGIHADVELPPGPARAGAVLLDQPLTRATQLQARAVHQQVHGFAVAARAWPRHLQRRGPAA